MCKENDHEYQAVATREYTDGVDVQALNRAVYRTIIGFCIKCGNTVPIADAVPKELTNA